MKRAHIWVTTYALTGGIREYVDAEIDDDGCAWASVIGMKFRYMTRAVDVHRSLAAALERAEVMRHAKIASLQRRIAVLEKKQIRMVKP